MVQILFTSWFNQKIANVLGDFKEERKPEEDPSPTRAVCRSVFVVLIMVGFLSLLVYHFIGSPDVWVEQINLSKEKDFARCSLYEKDNCKNSPSNHTTQRNPVVCPCKNKSVRWRDFVRFNVLLENSTEWSVTFEFYKKAGRTLPSIIVPNRTEANDNLLKNHVVKSETNITSDVFCNLIYYWPINDATRARIEAYGKYVCQYMASALLPAGNEYDDSFPISQNRTTEFLESPNLLNREVFENRVAELARESVLRGRLDLDIINFDNRIYLKAYNFFADILTRVLDKFENEEWCSYYQGAIDLQHHLNFIINMGDSNPWMIYLSDHEELHFLHPEINWTQYYEACQPLYCEETKKMSHTRQAYRAFGLLGGVTALVLGLVTVLLWPATAFVLSRYSRKSSAATNKASEHPEAPMVDSTGGSSTQTPPSHQPEVSVTSSPGESFKKFDFHRRTSTKQSEP